MPTENQRGKNEHGSLADISANSLPSAYGSSLRRQQSLEIAFRLDTPFEDLIVSEELRVEAMAILCKTANLYESSRYNTEKIQGMRYPLYAGRLLVNFATYAPGTVLIEDGKTGPAPTRLVTPHGSAIPVESVMSREAGCCAITGAMDMSAVDKLLESDPNMDEELMGDTTYCEAAHILPHGNSQAEVNGSLRPQTKIHMFSAKQNDILCQEPFGARKDSIISTMLNGPILQACSTNQPRT
ncbi:hypothetical protein BDD12DRAFT_808807 [Trichophaea hybrida]|nr:hypothetical protein BDD12DRAFT_808807 [Trichophaea hybrida]